MVAKRRSSAIDVFLAHASEDKDEVARPLAEALKQFGLSVWYDEYSLRLGDSLRQSIDDGLSQAKFGIVVLSPSFFEKSWPQWELDGLVAREVKAGKKLILPVWHKVDHDAVLQYSPPLADKVGVSTSLGIQHVAERVFQAFNDSTGGPSPASSTPRSASTGSQPRETRSVDFQELPAPWNTFRLDTEFRAEFREHESYSGNLEKVRSVIYREFPDDTSITFGNRPTIVSPLYWEVASGRPRESIYGLKKPSNLLSERSFTRHSLEHDYHQTLSKIYIFDPARYVQSVVDDFERKGESVDIRTRQLERRIEGLALARELVDQYPRLLLVCATEPVPARRSSFTSSSRFLVEMFPVLGPDGHIVRVRYSPNQPDYLLKHRSEAWRFARECGANRSDWPFESLEEIRLYPDAIAKFNRKSIDMLSDALARLLRP